MYDGLKKLEVPTKSRHPGARRGVKYGLIGLLVLVVFVVSTGIFTYLKVQSNISKGHRNFSGLIAPPPKGPLNILVLGSDARSVVEAGQRNERQFRGGSGQRADTIILLHIYAGSKHAVLISFPRDLRVNIPGHGINKINAAYPLGGANLMIKTVSQLTGLDINHYVEVNFASFRDIVNAVHGVPLYFPKPLYDLKSGLNITQTGCVTLNGDQALSFVRARYIYANADLGRIQGQQRFIRALLNRVKSLGVLLYPPTLIKLSEVAGKGLIFDKGIDLGLARSIANSLKFDQKNVDFRQYPGTPRYVGGVSYVVPEPTAARALFKCKSFASPRPTWRRTTAWKRRDRIDVRRARHAGPRRLYRQRRIRRGMERRAEPLRALRRLEGRDAFDNALTGQRTGAARDSGQCNCSGHDRDRDGRHRRRHVAGPVDPARPLRHDRGGDGGGRLPGVRRGQLYDGCSAQSEWRPLPRSLTHELSWMINRATAAP